MRSSKREWRVGPVTVEHASLRRVDAREQLAAVEGVESRAAPPPAEQRNAHERKRRLALSAACQREPGTAASATGVDRAITFARPARGRAQSRTYAASDQAVHGTTQLAQLLKPLRPDPGHGIEFVDRLEAPCSWR
jgi:hypothetical protein